MKTTESCSVCEAAVTPATSLMTERGLLCSSCFALWDTQQQNARAAEEQKNAVHFEKAARLAYLHGVNWAVGLILFAGWISVPGWLSGSLIAGVFVLAFGMRLQSTRAFRAAMVLDTAGSVVFAAASIALLRNARLLFLLFPVVFAWWLAFLTWRAREVFAGPSRSGL